MSTPSSTPERTREIEDVTNRLFIHPISRACVDAFARWGLSPNTVSLAGLGLGAGAALAYYHYHAGLAALLGFTLMIGWHVMDGADGQLARLTGQTSAWGKVLDGVCDYGTFVLVYLALALAAAPAWGAWAWIAAALAGASHAAQASAYEFQRQVYDFIGRGKEAAHLDDPAAVRQARRRKTGLARLFDTFYLGYLRLQRRVAVVDEALLDDFGEALRRADEASAERLRAGFRKRQAADVRRWGVLCSNYRTLAIFLVCLAGMPVLYFWFEIVALNAALVLLVRRQRAKNQTLRSWLAAQRAPEHDVEGATAVS